MKNWMKTLFLAVSLCAAPMVSAEKVAVIDVQVAVMSTETVQKAIKDLQNKPEFSALVANVESIKAEVQRISQDAQQNGGTWSAEQKAEARKKIEYKQADYQLAAKKIQAEEQAALQAVMKEMNPKVEAALNKIISAEGITLVLNKKAAVFATPAHDITAKLTERLNKAK